MRSKAVGNMASRVLLVRCRVGPNRAARLSLRASPSCCVAAEEAAAAPPGPVRLQPLSEAGDPRAAPAPGATPAPTPAHDPSSCMQRLWGRPHPHPPAVRPRSADKSFFHVRLIRGRLADGGARAGRRACRHEGDGDDVAAAAPPGPPADAGCQLGGLLRHSRLRNQLAGPVEPGPQHSGASEDATIGCLSLSAVLKSSEHLDSQLCD